MITDLYLMTPKFDNEAYNVKMNYSNYCYFSYVVSWLVLTIKVLTLIRIQCNALEPSIRYKSTH